MFVLFQKFHDSQKGSFGDAVDLIATQRQIYWSDERLCVCHHLIPFC